MIKSVGVEKIQNRELIELAERAALRKSNPEKRYAPNSHDLKKASENARLMQLCQYQAVKTDGGDL